MVEFGVFGDLDTRLENFLKKLEVRDGLVLAFRRAG